MALDYKTIGKETAGLFNIDLLTKVVHLNETGEDRSGEVVTCTDWYRDEKPVLAEHKEEGSATIQKARFREVLEPVFKMGVPLPQPTYVPCIYLEILGQLRYDEFGLQTQSGNVHIKPAIGEEAQRSFVVFDVSVQDLFRRFTKAVEAFKKHRCKIYAEGQDFESPYGKETGYSNEIQKAGGNQADKRTK